MMRTFIVLLLLTVVGIVVCVLCLNDHVVAKNVNAPKQSNLVVPTNETVKYITYYQEAYIEQYHFDTCKYKCRLTQFDDYLKSDAVIFHGPSLTEESRPPKKGTGQIWVFHSKEAPSYYTSEVSNWKNLFNWTMSYRRDSDIIAMNGMFTKRKNRTNLNTALYSSKSKSIAWFVSNCDTPGKREEFVKFLLKTGDRVDIYGECGELKCSKSNESLCMDMLRNHYKFYLAFENSLCLDYITEKSFKVYSGLVDAIPITRGVGDQYKIYLPPNSYINTIDFSTFDALSIYMKKVLTNKTLFDFYFKWKLHYIAYTPHNAEYCEVCRMVHHAEKYKRIYPDLGAWKKLRKYKTVCTSPTDVQVNKSFLGRTR